MAKIGTFHVQSERIRLAQAYAIHPSLETGSDTSILLDWASLKFNDVPHKTRQAQP
jgi:hypothetical protein